MVKTATMSVQVNESVKEKVNAILENEGVSLERVFDDYLQSLANNGYVSFKTMVNADKTSKDAMDSLRQNQMLYGDEVDKLGIVTMQDIVDMIKEVRREIWEEKYGAQTASDA